MTKEMWENAKSAKSVEELMALARQNDIELTAERAKEVFDQVRAGELSDDDLESVAGGVADNEGITIVTPDSITVIDGKKKIVLK